MRRIEIAPAARAELDDAADFYEREYPGRGIRFYDAFEKAIRAAALTPNAGQSFPGVDKRLGVRRRVVARFPFVIAYRDLGDAIRVEAVAHAKRRPRYWLSRIE